MALQHRRLGDRARLERGEGLGALAIEGDLDDRRQARPAARRREDRDTPLDDPTLDEALDATQAGGRRDVGTRGKRFVRQRRVFLELAQYPQIGGVESDWFLHE